MKAYEFTFKNKWSSGGLRPIVVIGSTLAKALKRAEKEALRVTNCPNKFRKYIALDSLRTLDVIIIQ